ncbi:PREDICTED: dual specificity phosphatase 21 [Diuraphis noxia]|uniref:dual specificity phosphatase 21 n=1 Tax=Diuraphis noxia TaxID=143948 RepID=UPI0007636F2C|nr:PREDICTED: dual specificity phosphatase 21 [Diuraphis noxia]
MGLFTQIFKLTNALIRSSAWWSLITARWRRATDQRSKYYKSSCPSAFSKQPSADIMASTAVLLGRYSSQSAEPLHDRRNNRVPINGGVAIVLDKSDLFSVSPICPGLALCGALSIYTDKETVAALRPTCLINCAGELPDTPLPDTVHRYHKVPVTDTVVTDLGPHMDTVTDLIHQEYISGGTTIIHCAAGVSRSAAFCIAYLIKYRGMTMSNAYRHVAKCRPCINPNTGFISQLIEFEGKFREE